MHRLLVALAVLGVSAACWAEAPRIQRDAYGAIVRGDVGEKSLALLFTGDRYGESTAPILETLKSRRIAATFFLTGRFLRQKSLVPLVQRMLAEGHEIGPHSDGHLLYCDWSRRDKSLIAQEDFAADLRKNVERLRALGACPPGRAIHFVPPFEWYNRDQVAWCRDLSEKNAFGKATPIRLVNFTPGAGSQRDYARENDPHFVPAKTIYDDVLAYERREPQGLNGFLLLLHLGSGRDDPFHPLLGPLCDELIARGYRFVRVGELVAGG
jgi:peptidoglycan/xylan/chitin deacetylase (PgdA/CDA1 family)